MHRVLFIVIITLLTTPALADEPPDWRVEGAVHVGYLLAGGSAIPGGRAPATGGAALIPTVRGLRSLRVVDPYAGLSPILVTPSHLETLGLVTALDVGLAWHPDSRAWYVGTAASLAPSYMRFCNAVPWCLREGVILYGGELHGAGRIWTAQGGAGLSFTANARLLTGRPTAWYWPRLSPIERAVNHYSLVIAGGLLWRF